MITDDFMHEKGIKLWYGPNTVPRMESHVALDPGIDPINFNVFQALWKRFELT